MIIRRRSQKFLNLYRLLLKALLLLLLHLLVLPLLLLLLLLLLLRRLLLLLRLRLHLLHLHPHPLKTNILLFVRFANLLQLSHPFLRRR